MNTAKPSRPLIGQDPSIQKVLKLVDKVAPTDSSVLVLGERHREGTDRACPSRTQPARAETNGAHKLWCDTRKFT